MIKENLNKIRAQIIVAEQQFNRALDSVRLLAVSKGQSLEAIRIAAQAGQKCFGENYVQEAFKKITALQNLNLEWHFIGNIQANKTQIIANNFSWVHSVDRYKIAKRLSEQRPDSLPPLNICIEVNVSGELQKSGVLPDELPQLAKAIYELPNIKFRGLMSIPQVSEDFNKQRAVFATLRQAFESLQAQGFVIDTISAGMSHDFIAAIAEGSTVLRIGTAIFGIRK